ncbi:unnamed protein product, partial [Closterium sp. NIES-53]
AATSVAICLPFLTVGARQGLANGGRFLGGGVANSDDESKDAETSFVVVLVVEVIVVVEAGYFDDVVVTVVAEAEGVLRGAGADCPHPPSLEVPQPPPAVVVPQPPPAVVVPQPPPAATPASVVVAAPPSSDVGMAFHPLAAASFGVRTSPYGPTAGTGLPKPVARAVVFSPVSGSAVADFPLSSSSSIVAGSVPPSLEVEAVGTVRSRRRPSEAGRSRSISFGSSQHVADVNSEVSVVGLKANFSDVIGFETSVVGDEALKIPGVDALAIASRNPSDLWSDDAVEIPGVRQEGDVSPCINTGRGLRCQWRQLKIRAKVSGSNPSVCTSGIPVRGGVRGPLLMIDPLPLSFVEMRAGVLEVLATEGDDKVAVTAEDVEGAEDCWPEELLRLSSAAFRL